MEELGFIEVERKHRKTHTIKVILNMAKMFPQGMAKICPQHGKNMPSTWKKSAHQGSSSKDLPKGSYSEYSILNEPDLNPATE